jgi:RNA recognition motif-containing protein
MVDEESNKLFVNNLHSSMTEGELIKLFQRFGNVVEVEYAWHKSGYKYANIQYTCYCY